MLNLFFFLRGLSLNLCERNIKVGPVKTSFPLAPVKKKQSNVIRAGGVDEAGGGRDELGQVTEGAGLHDAGSGGSGVREGAGRNANNRVWKAAAASRNVDNNKTLSHLIIQLSR